MSISVQPWPDYADDGSGPFWRVRAEAQGFTGWIIWASHLGRFVRTNELARLRRSNARLLFVAAQFMSNFDAASRDIAGTPGGHKTGEKGHSGGTDTGTFPRARAGTLRVDVPMSPGTFQPGHFSDNRDIASNTSGGRPGCRRSLVDHQSSPGEPVLRPEQGAMAALWITLAVIGLVLGEGLL